MATVGVGVKEIRIYEQGAHRVVYIAKFTEAVYIVHAFEKKVQKTPRATIDLARRRYKGLIAERRKKP